MPNDKKDIDVAEHSQDVDICARILNDTITNLAARFGVAPVVLALTDIMDCHACGKIKVSAGYRDPGPNN